MFRVPKNKQGYGYKYADLSQIHQLLEENGLSYYQFVKCIDGNDYIMTVRIDADGNESEPIQGCRVVEAVLSGKSNPAQEHGSALTYARRYSLQMAYGLATEDDDAESLTRKPEPVKPKGKAKPISDMQFVSVTDAIDAMGKTQLAICEHYGIGSISDMNTDQYTDLMKIYNAWRAKQNA